MSSKSNPSNIILQSPPNILVMSQKNNKKKKKLNMFLVHDEEHLSRQVSSNEGYYHDVGESASVPFVWESQPGTPKVVRFRETSFPPLTPPPSYNYQNATPKNPLFTNGKNNKNSSKSTSLFKALLFPKKRNNNNNKGCVVVPPSPESPNSWSHSLSSSSSSLSWRPTSYSVPNSPMIKMVFLVYVQEAWRSPLLLLEIAIGVEFVVGRCCSWKSLHRRGEGRRWPLLRLEVATPSGGGRRAVGVERCAVGVEVAAIRVEVAVEVKCVWQLCVIEKKKKKEEEEVVCDGCV
ncbi:uncharacterized protein DS421_7g210720 [Arachis hypogaea]|nr:uncharacterized protein DS421_7g210720 [Arachis hypogaea]